MGTGLARDHWTTYDPTHGFAAWQYYVAYLAEHCQALVQTFPSQVSYGKVGFRLASETSLVVWGANARN